MDSEKTQRFLEAAEQDYQECVSAYMDAMRSGRLQRIVDRREARVDVLSAQMVLDLALAEASEARLRSELQEG
jgi:hypothetical protein